MLPAVALAALAILVLSRGRRGRGSSLLADLEAKVYQALRPLELEPSAQETLTRIAAAAAAEGISVTATSGRRDAERQAAAMLNKVERGEDLLKLYKDKDQVRALLAGPRTVSAWADTIRQYARAGRPLSSHLSGRAVDLRIRGLTPAQVERLRGLAVALGARRAILEPDHLHLEL